MIVGGIMQTIAATAADLLRRLPAAVSARGRGPGRRPVHGRLRRDVGPSGIWTLALDATITFALADTIDKLQPAAVQALNALFNYDFLVFALGAQLFLLALGISLVRHGALPKWVGWIADRARGDRGHAARLHRAARHASCSILIMSVILLMRDPGARRVRQAARRPA